MLILTVLKWILIFILIVLLAVVIIAAYLLVVPFFYDIKINFDERKFEFYLKDFLRLYNVGFLKTKKNMDFSLKFLFGILDLSPKEKTPKKTKDKIKEKEEKEEKEVRDSLENSEKSEKSDKSDKKTEKNKEKQKAVLKEKETYEAFKYAVFETFKVLKKLFPREFYAQMDFSLGRPDLTGLLTGGISLLPFIYQNDSKVIPDFLSEKAYVSGFLKISGYFALINIVILTVKLLCNKQIRRILQTFR